MNSSELKATLWQSIKNFDVKGMIDTIASSRFDWVEISASCAAGFLSGFLLKRYFKLFLSTIIIGVFVITVLDYFQFIQIDWNRVFSVIGIQPSQQTFNNVYTAVIGWMSMNVQGVTSFAVGFFVGIKFS